MKTEKEKVKYQQTEKQKYQASKVKKSEKVKK